MVEKSQRMVRLLNCCVIVTVAAGAVRGATNTYTATDLSQYGSYVNAVAINKNGVVVGNFLRTPTDAMRVFTWTNGQFSDQGTISTYDTWVYSRDPCRINVSWPGQPDSDACFFLNVR